MTEHDLQVIMRIKKHTEAIILYTSSCSSVDDFAADSILTDACVFNLMQIGELAKQQLSDEAKEQISSIPWKQLYGLRNRIVHGYDGVKMNIVWETIKNDIPFLDEALKKITQK